MYEISKNDIKICDWLSFKFCAKHGFHWGDDEKQEAREGMVYAATKYNSDIGTFWSYAKFWVRQRIYLYLFNKYPGCKYYRSSEIFKVSHRASKIAYGDVYKSGDFLKDDAYFHCGGHEKEIINKDLIKKCFDKMPAHVKEALYANVFNGVPYIKTAKKYGLNERSVSALICQWRDAWIEDKNKRSLRKTPIPKKRYKRNA